MTSYSAQETDAVQTHQTSPAFAWLSLITSIGVYLLAVTGTFVRLSGSGLACADWPTCQGQWLPPLETSALISTGHRAATLGVGLLALVTAGVAWQRYRRAVWIVWPAVLSVILLVVQVILGGLTVIFALEPLITTAHLGAALLLIATTLTVTATAFAGGRVAPITVGDEVRRAIRRFSYYATALAIILFGLLLAGATASLVIPDTAGRWSTPHWSFGLITVAAVAASAMQAWRLRRVVPGVALLGSSGLVLVLLELATRTGSAPALPAPEAGVLHLAIGTGLWATVAATAALAWSGAGRLATTAGSEPVALSVPAAGPVAQRSRSGLSIRAYIALMKPRIIVLLLITTLAAMVLAQRGLPPLMLIIATMLGGALAAGGANAINQYLDRDIDQLMKRTRQRPLPQHHVPPKHALIFGISLGLLSFLILYVFANLLAAILALVGLLFYVFVYTALLKRTTPQNIVIGGAAGAIPPLVGWAAVANELSLPALYLFALVFFWTPPHFWALSLLLKADYAAARVPMLPVILGEAETKRQIVLYSVLLFAVSLLLFAGRMVGLWYLAAALVLGAILIGMAVQLMRGEERRWARRLFFFSNAYLALLFAAMIVDSVVLKATP